MSVSVIIAHYAPEKNCGVWRDLLKRTIQSVRSQHIEAAVEIILCDDGAWWSQAISEGSPSIVQLQRSDIQTHPILADLDVDAYLRAPDSGRYLGTALKHQAFLIATYDDVVVLDDDHPLTSRTALSRFVKYLERYQFVRGRVIGPDGLPQLFSSGNAQGTTYALKRSLYFQAGGFGKYLFTNAVGEDNDILWRIYTTLTKVSGGQRLAAYAGDIVTRDLGSNRWRDRLAEGDTNPTDPNIHFVATFIDEYGVHPWDNPSRNKALWVDQPSFRSKASDYYYATLHLLHQVRRRFGIIVKRVAGNRR